MLINLIFEIDKHIIMQFKTNPSNINYKVLTTGINSSFNDVFWDYWVFDTYEEAYNFVDENLHDYLYIFDDEEIGE